MRVCTDPTVTRYQLSRQDSSAFSTAQRSPVAVSSLSAACSSSSPRWARIRHRPPWRTMSSTILQNTIVFPHPVGRTRSVL